MGRKGSSRGSDYMRGLKWGMKGEEVVEANLNKQLEGIKVRSLSGLIKAAAFIRNQTEHTPPLTPVDLGNLRASWFVTTAKSIPVGRGTHQFRGLKAGKMSEEHTSVVTEAQGMVVSQSTKDKQFLIMGYSANYGGFVHEMIGAKNMSRPGSDVKWLETHIKSNTSKIVQIVKEDAQIKG